MLNELNNIAFSLFDSMHRCMHENIVKEKWLGTDLIINSKNKVIKYFIWTRMPTSIFSTKKKKITTSNKSVIVLHVLVLDCKCPFVIHCYI